MATSARSQILSRSFSVALSTAACSPPSVHSSEVTDSWRTGSFVVVFSFFWGGGGMTRKITTDILFFSSASSAFQKLPPICCSVKGAVHLKIKHAYFSSYLAMLPRLRSPSLKYNGARWHSAFGAQNAK